MNRNELSNNEYLCGRISAFGDTEELMPYLHDLADKLHEQGEYADECTLRDAIESLHFMYKDFKSVTRELIRRNELGKS